MCAIDQPLRGRRRALIVVAGMAALLAVGDMVRRRVASSDNGVAGVAIHTRPRELPPLRFTDEHGVPTSLAAFRGRVVVLNVWATWCPPCRAERPTLDRLQAALGGPNFEVVTLSIDEGGLAAVQPFFRQLGIKHLHPYLDGFHEAAALVATGIPLTLLIDCDGRAAGRKLGPAGAAVWCAKDRAKAWDDAIRTGAAPADDSGCDTPIATIADFARQHRINGTPTMVLSDGRRLVGAVPRAELEQRLVRAAKP